MISCHRAVHSRYSCHAPRARIPCNKYHAGRMRAPPRAHDQSDRYLDILRARISSSSLSASSRSPASSTDGHQYRQRRCHHRRRYPRTVVIPIIAAAVAIFIIVAAVADVILSSPTSEYRHHALISVADSLTSSLVSRAPSSVTLSVVPPTSAS